ncbi:MAG: hypothetical protein ACOYBW_01200 [Fluviibacter phosphoraccumulans]
MSFISTYQSAAAVRARNQLPFGIYKLKEHAGDLKKICLELDKISSALSGTCHVTGYTSLVPGEENLWLGQVFQSLPKMLGEILPAIEALVGDGLSKAESKLLIDRYTPALDDLVIALDGWSEVLTDVFDPNGLPCDSFWADTMKGLIGSCLGVFDKLLGDINHLKPST